MVNPNCTRVLREPLRRMTKEQGIAVAIEAGKERQVSSSSTEPKRFLSGMRGFTILWLGQFTSILGTAMTAFALTIWAWRITGQATALALVSFFHFAPTVLVSPIAGALVDRWNRKLTMILSDLAAGISTVVVLILLMNGQLQVWHLYLMGAFSGAFQAFHFPAYSAAVTMMMPKEQYARASGMLALAESSSNIVAPIAASILIGIIEVAGIMVLDIVTFLTAIGILLLIHIPTPISDIGDAKRRSLWRDSLYGFQYIYEKTSLLGLLLIFFTFNLTTTFAFTLLAPMILTRTSNNTVVFGGVQSAFGIGGVAGGALMSIWGGPRRRVNGILMGMTFSSLLGGMMMGLGREPAVWIVAAFFCTAFLPIANGCSQSIWQAKVPPNLQGRVFATRRLIAQITAPFAMAMAGPLADWVFGPAMMPQGKLAPILGWLVGTGPGAGMSLMFVTTGILGAIIGLSGYAFKTIRNVEKILPDHDVRTAS